MQGEDVGLGAVVAVAGVALGVGACHAQPGGVGQTLSGLGRGGGLIAAPVIEGVGQELLSEELVGQIGADFGAVEGLIRLVIDFFRAQIPGLGIAAVGGAAQQAVLVRPGHRAAL